MSGQCPWYGRFVERQLDPVTDEIVELVRDGYRMVLEGDPAFLDSMDPDVEWHVPDTIPGGGDLKGTMEVLEFMAGIGDLWEASVHPEEFLPSGVTLVVLGTWHLRARSTGVELASPFAHVTRYRNGKVVYFRNYTDASKIMRTLESGPSG